MMPRHPRILDHIAGWLSGRQDRGDLLLVEPAAVLLAFHRAALDAAGGDAAEALARLAGALCDLLAEPVDPADLAWLTDAHPEIDPDRAARLVREARCQPEVLH